MESRGEAFDGQKFNVIWRTTWIVRSSVHIGSSERTFCFGFRFKGMFQQFQHEMAILLRHAGLDVALIAEGRNLCFELIQEMEACIAINVHEVWFDSKFIFSLTRIFGSGWKVL